MQPYPPRTCSARADIPRLASAWSAASLIVLGLLALPVGATSLFGGKDPLRTESKTASTPATAWETTKPLPPVPAPPQVGTPIPASALSLPELTEYALRNNPRARQAWFAARAAAAGVAIDQADLLPQVTGAYAWSRTLPVSATTGSASPWLTRHGPSISISYMLFDF